MMIPAFHRPGRHWPTMLRHAPPFVDAPLARALSGREWVGCVTEWVAFMALVTISVVVPIFLG